MSSVQVSHAYDLVNRLRPAWLRPRRVSGGTSGYAMDGGVVVLVNGTRYGGVESLRQISVGMIGTIEFLGQGEVQREFTSQSGEGIVGAIVIHTAK